MECRVASLPDIDVERIARAAQAGNADALDDLIRNVRPRVFRWAVVQTGNPDDAEDVAQDVALLLARRLDRYRGGSFAAWLYRITSNAVKDARRRVLRRRTVRWSTADEVEAAVGQSPLDALIGQELGATLGRFMGELPARQREVLDLVDVQGHAAVEAAEMLEIDPATARVHLLRARRALRKRLLEEMDDEL